MQPITNLTELWQDEEKNLALRLCGTGQGISDYETFQNLCACFAAMPGHPIRLHARKQLLQRFTCKLPPVPENAEIIWKLTAEALLQGERTQTTDDFATLVDEEKNACANFPLSTARIADFSIPATLENVDYTAWKQAQIAHFKANSPPKGIRLSLSSDFRAVKPNLYAVERHLAHADADEALWLAQVFRFFAGYAAQNKLALLLETGCSAEQVAKLLALTASVVRLPQILWAPERVGDFLQAAQLVSAYDSPSLRYAVLPGMQVDRFALATAVPLGMVCVFQ